MKRCTKCGTDKPEEAFEMQPSRGRLRSECRECRKIAAREWVAKRRLNPPKPKTETKRCKRCQEVKPNSEFSPSSPGYFCAYCKACTSAMHQEERREQYRNNPTGRYYWPFMNESGVMVKRCTYCFAEKPLSEFYPNGKNRRHGKCKECDKTLKKLIYDNNPEKYRAISRDWARRHPDVHRASEQRWRSANRERRIHYHREHHRVHHERYLAYDKARHSKETSEDHHKQYEQRRDYHQEYGKRNRERMDNNARRHRQTFPEKYAEIQNRRRAHKRNAPRIEKIDRIAIFERDKWTCYLCMQICTLKNVSLDHVIPLFRGGSHTADNLRVACRSCNSRKGTRFLKDFLK